MTELHVKEELGSLDLTIVRLEDKPVESWTVEIRNGDNFVVMTVEDLENVRSKIDLMIKEAKEADL